MKVAGFSPIGVDSYRFPQTRGDSTFQWSDSLTVTRGRASYVTGFDIWYTRLDSDVNRNARPLVEFWGQRLQFPGPAALYDPGAQPEPLLGPASFAAMGVPQALRQTAAAVADSSLRLHRKQIDFLVQNTYRLGRNVRLIAGVRVMLNRLPESDDLRFEKSFDRNLFESQLSATQGACNQLPAAQSGDCLNRVSYLSRAFPRGFQDVFGAAPVNADPRVGLAWSPGSSGKWAIRAGWGRYGGQFPAVILNESRSTFPQYLSLNFREFPTSGGLLFNPAAPDHTDVHFLAPGSLNRLRQTDPVALLARDLIYNTVRLENVMPASGLQDPYSMQYGLTVERELFRDSVLSLAYVGTQGRNLLRMTEPDPYGPPMPYLLPFTGGLNGTAIPVFLGTNIVRENLSSSLFLTPTVARTFLETSGSSSYNSLQLDFRGRRAAGGLGYGAAFTWSHSIDNASDFFDTAGAPALPQDNLRNSERGSSGFDSRLRLAGHFIWEIPAAGKFLRGWQLAGICAAQTGQPFTVNTVYDVNQDGVLTDRLDNTDGLNIGGADRRTALGFAPSPGLPAAQLLSAAERKLGATGCRTGLAPGASN
ncbi:MAG: hypothetical protein LAQ30_32825, partial [Acidobacteriia bacterium]|nr:hypothetical protein [Terriglobia bacterium]